MTSSTMLSLPVVVQHRVCWRLPLCDASALALAGALVESDPAKCATQLANTLAADPALAVWAVLAYSLDMVRQQSVELSGDNHLSIAELAHWLSSRLIKLLDQLDNENIALSDEQHGRFAALVAESAAAAFQTLHFRIT